MVTHLSVITLKSFYARWRGVKAFKYFLKPVFIPRCQAVHTFGLKQSLHLLWLSKTGKLIRLDRAVKPNTICFCRGAFGVVEAPARIDFPDYPVGHYFRLKGQALVEAAFVMPVLFLMLFGFLELSLLLHSQQQLTYAVQHATQVGSLTNNDLKIMGAIESFYKPEEVAVAIVNTDTSTNQAITSADRRYNHLLQVQLSSPYQLHVPFWPVEVFDLTAEASARVLCNQNNPPYQCD